MEVNQILQGDTLEVLKTLPEESIDMVITSPPYWGLRNYGVEGQLGLEATFQEYIDKLCNMFDEVKRVLKKEGTCWVNLGDTYGQNWRGGGVPPKSLVQIPSRFAIEMSNRGWILRNEIIWHKPNCMPSSVKDRFTVDFEKIFFFVKNKKYWFETQYEPLQQTSIERMGRKWCGSKNKKFGQENNKQQVIDAEERMDANRWANDKGRNKRCVWPITLRGYRGAHFATYPEELIETPIKAGCPEGGIVLDIFMGSGTTGVVAKKLGRNYLGIELNPEYIEIANKRLYERKK